MILYLDDENKLHCNNDGTMTEINLNWLDNQCQRVIEAYKYYPEKNLLILWDNADVVFGVQEQYEKDQLVMQDMQTALSILGVEE